MSWIETIAPAEAEGEIADLYRRVAGPGGAVDHVLQVHSLRPHTLAGHMALYKAVLHHRGNALPAWFQEALGTRVSHLNGCRYCEAHHRAGMRRAAEVAGVDAERLDAAVCARSPGEPFDQAQRAALAYADRLTRDPGGTRRDDIAGLRAAGFDDGEILEINQVVAYFAYANRTVSGLGVELEASGLGHSPNAADDPDDWSHR